MSQLASSTPLVTTNWVAENLESGDFVLVEVDEDSDAYATGHIAGSIAFNWRTDLQDPVKRDFIGPEAFADLLDRSAIGQDTTVVLYGGNNNWFAAYAYWYFRYYGHSDVRLMDGGRKKWELENRPFTTEVPDVKATKGYKTVGSDDSIRALRDEVRDFIDAKRGNLVDVRSPEEYRGELLAPAHLPQEAAQRGGHIPGAANIPWSKSVDPETGAFLSTEQLRDLYGGQGVTPDKEVIAYCRIGERSAHTWFVLHELLEFPNVRNYDGSWTEWGSLVGAPIER
ncbi:MAG TPA: sulfurtransferase [Acidimicrobiales bacterium]|nr:sulfurtransferase [Acidimicrobiales bacterium]